MEDGEPFTPSLPAARPPASLPARDPADEAIPGALVESYQRLSEQLSRLMEPAGPGSSAAPGIPGLGGGAQVGIGAPADRAAARLLTPAAAESPAPAKPPAAEPRLSIGSLEVTVVPTPPASRKGLRRRSPSRARGDGNRGDAGGSGSTAGTGFGRGRVSLGPFGLGQM